MGRLRVFEMYQESVVGYFLEQWTNKLLYAGFRHWIDQDYSYKIQLLDERVAKILLDPSNKQQDVSGEVYLAPTETKTKRTPVQIQDVIDWLTVRYTDTLLLSTLEEQGLQHLGTTVGHILTIQPGETIFQDSDGPITSLGCWLVLSGTVVVSIDPNQPSKNISMGCGQKFTSKALCLQSVHFEAATKDELFQCPAGFTARANEDTRDEKCKVLFISKACFIGSIYHCILSRKNQIHRFKTIKTFVVGLVGNKGSNKGSGISDHEQELTINRLASQASVEHLNRKSIVKPRSQYLGIAEEGTFTVYATLKCKHDKQGQRTQVAVMNDIGSIVHCSAKEANCNKVIAKRTKFTRFDHQVVVSSSHAVVVWVPLVLVYLGNSTNSTSNSALRTALSQIVEIQAVQRKNRSNAATATLTKVFNQTDKDRRRQKKTRTLSDANAKAECLKQHISEFMDWKNKADADMDFGGLDLSPTRPSLSVVSPTQARWTWNHSNRDFAGGSSARSSGESEGGARNSRMGKAGKASPSKYAVPSGRKTYQ